jgi:proline racemase
LRRRGIVVSRIQTLDAHIGGEPLRLIISGFPEPPGAAVLERREWLRGNHDDLRTAILLEARGHAEMYGAAADTSRISGR